ncbi:hypothetical protein DFH09DRAFT_1315435 [Mycena vulgaris]|nr:hypothetical protein DFH09DRAFT_1315435 [Mycena vulgaris]
MERILVLISWFLLSAAALHKVCYPVLRLPFQCDIITTIRCVVPPALRRR